MPGIARKDGVDRVRTNHGCDPITATLEGSSDVFVNNVGVVRRGDKTAVHNILVGVVCVPHQVPLTSFSPDVFVNGLEVGRQGDAYGSNEVLETGSLDVFAN